MPSSRFDLRLANGRTLSGLLDLPDRAGPRPVVVCCHGFKGFCEWGFWPPLAQLLSERGFAVVRFNFTGAGVRLGDDQVTDLEAFRANSYLRERDELLTVLDRLGELGGAAFDCARVGLVGHSRGGGVALLAAAHPDWRQRLGALVTWSAISHCDRWSLAEKEAWRARGDLPVVNTRTGQVLGLGVELLDEVELHHAEHDLVAAAIGRQAPWLLLHGEDDEAVPADEARTLAAAAALPVELRFVHLGTHTYGAGHPFAGPTRELTAVFNASQRWLRRWLTPSEPGTRFGDTGTFTAFDSPLRIDPQ